jgi:hypothetical protein
MEKYNVTLSEDGRKALGELASKSKQNLKKSSMR